MSMSVESFKWNKYYVYVHVNCPDLHKLDYTFSNTRVILVLVVNMKLA